MGKVIRHYGPVDEIGAGGEVNNSLQDCRAATILAATVPIRNRFVDGLGIIMNTVSTSAIVFDIAPDLAYEVRQHSVMKSAREQRYPYLIS